MIRLPVASEAARAGRAPTPGDLLLHPAALVALTVVIVNDRILKVHHRGMISGKLSDFAGLVYFPLFVATLIELGRLVFGHKAWVASTRLVTTLAMVTGVIFALAKIWTPWADAYRRIFGAIWWPIDAVTSLVGGHGWPPVGRLGLTQDPTDLIALPMLLVPIAIAQRVSKTRNQPSTEATSG